MVDRIMHDRVAPKLAVLSLDGSMLSSEPGLAEFLARYADLAPVVEPRLPEPIMEAVREAARTLAAQCDGCASSVSYPVPGLVLRAVVLKGPEGSCIAVTFEPLQFRKELRASVAHYHLSARESEIAALLVRGNSVPQIAQFLGISANTAREHLKHIHVKIGVRTRAELVCKLLNASHD